MRLIGAQRFAELIGAALAQGDGFAAGKLGETERALLQYPMVLDREADRMRVWAFERALIFRGLATAGLFPPDPAFYRRFTELYAERVRRLDCVGMNTTLWRTSLDIVGFHGIEGELMSYLDQEPDRSTPSDESRCWLPHLRGRRVLLVSPFARELAERATRETFEAVWAEIAKPWFHPAHVDALEFPYGYSPMTWDSFPTALNLLDDITIRIAQRDFDVAIIGAGALGIPIATFVKGMGRVGISLGGHIQPLFGVSGERWRTDEGWQHYLNEAWIDLPPEYRPDPGQTIENYW
jgi:hypothetical protein